MKILKGHLKSRKVSVSGLKSELVKRLKDIVDAEKGPEGQGCLPFSLLKFTAYRSKLQIDKECLMAALVSGGSGYGLKEDSGKKRRAAVERHQSEGLEGNCVAGAAVSPGRSCDYILLSKLNCFSSRPVINSQGVLETHSQSQDLTAAPSTQTIHFPLTAVFHGYSFCVERQMAEGNTL